MACKDPIGQALLDYFKGGSEERLIVKSSISEDDDIPVDYLFRPFIDLPKLEKKAINMCRGDVLDVGAAAGAHSMILKEKGFNVTSIDTSKGAVEVMKKRGLDNAFGIDYFDFEGKFDTILMLMNGLGIAGTIDNLPNYLNKARSLLNEGGQLIVDSSDIQYMFEEDDGSMWVDLNSSYYGEVQYQLQYKDCVSDEFDWLFIDFERLNLIASENGWKCELVEKGMNFDYLVRMSLK